MPLPNTSKRREDPRWRSALGGDDARAAELGADVAWTEIADALRDEAAIREVALRALPYAGDRDGSLGALAAALDRPRGDEASVADAIERVVTGDRRDAEVASRDGARACASSLLRVAEQGGRGGLDVARAQALARRVLE